MGCDPQVGIYINWIFPPAHLRHLLDISSWSPDNSLIFENEDKLYFECDIFDMHIHHQENIKQSILCSCKYNNNNNNNGYF